MASKKKKAKAQVSESVTETVEPTPELSGNEKFRGDAKTHIEPPKPPNRPPKAVKKLKRMTPQEARQMQLEAGLLPRIPEKPVLAPEAIPLRAYVAASGYKWDRMAGFIRWVKNRGAAPRTMEAWRAAFKEYNESPTL